MPDWSQPGILWNDGSLWSHPTPPPDPTPAYLKPKTKLKPMKRQKYYPSNQDQEPEWLTNFAFVLPQHTASLSLDSGTVEEAVADARWLAYMINDWLSVTRAFPEAVTSALKEARTGTGTEALVLPALVAPPLPAGDPDATPPIPPVVARPPGALDRIFRLVKDIKNKPGFTEAVGNELRVLGDSYSEPDLPKFSLKAVQGQGCQCVEIRFFKYGRTGVWIESRRGGGAWEMLGIDTESPYLDERALLAAGVPEVREYRMRFWHKGSPTGDWTDIASITVAP
ncbi:MAG TPA: hypothetical protein DIT64_19590 [Verrucomicrobiales bacterium]|nr:hypothetical protein [Verrucomicrobiales bacterium]